MRTIVRISVGLLVALAVLALGLVVAVSVRQNRTFTAPYPDLHASTDPAIVARGEYLVRGPAHCSECHGDPSAPYGQNWPLTGGREWELPIGKIRAPNITADVETGIGGLSDGEVARVLRHGVLPDGRAAIPFMRFTDMSENDMRAVLSYLRTVPAVRHPVSPKELSVLGRFVMAFVIAPTGPSMPVVTEVTPGSHAIYGAYLANSVAGCVTCHTRLDLRTGAYVGPRFGGGEPMPADGNPSLLLTPVDLRPGGHLASWDEETFVTRFRRGPVYRGSPMPWSAMSRMTESDIRAIYRYLQTLPRKDKDGFASR